VVSPYRASDPLLKRRLHSAGIFSLAHRIVNHVFSLDEACNLALVCLVALHFLSHLLVISAVDASLHITMDKYAMLAITCSDKFLNMFIEIIAAENNEWLSRIAKGQRYMRELKVSWLGLAWCFSTHLVANVAL